MSIRVDDERVQELLRTMPEGMFHLIKEEVSVSTLAVHERVSRGFTGGDGLNSRTGQLRRSLITKITGDNLNTLEGRVVAGGGSNEIKYAILQEQGGHIRPTGNKYAGVPGGPYINIPLAANKTAAGVMRQSARMVFSAGGYIVKARSQKYFVMSAAGLPMFLLSKGVYVPPRLGMKKAMDDEVPTLLSNINHRINEFLG